METSNMDPHMASGKDAQWPIPHDIVCDLPDALALYVREHGALPENVTLEENFLCSWGEERYFIHASVTLPLVDLGQGVGFGLWVEVTAQDFSRYLDALEDDEQYTSFQSEGVLANHWPGFPDALGLKVVMGASEVGQKVRIQGVMGELEAVDPMLHLFMNISPDDAPGLREYLHIHLPGFFE